ncbi:helix-turn-helix domain-containing protein [Pontiellaceae bacterium B12227]|nr:helix-turn-helix domain-containing protein [Pontiellaceae bacterium B12227]
MQNVSNDEIIQAVFTADDEAKHRALAILKGEADPSSDFGPQPSDEGPLLMGMGDSAKLLGVSRATLWRMIRDGRLTKVEIYHNAFRLRRSDILALVNERTAGILPAPASLSTTH